MQIRQLEAKTGLERATIRFYEREGFICPKRHDNGYREYSTEDCETLLKIKLLRKLGISLERIQDLQQGRAVFLDALAEQITALEEQIQTAQSAKNVCEQMRCDGVNYSTLNAEYYLKILDEPINGFKKIATAPVPEFHAKMYLERHPVRRYVARWLDLTLLTTILCFIVFVLLRIRFETKLLQNIISIGCIFLIVPVNALLISHFGTTPGKWVMGIRALSCNGNLLSYEDAKDREWGVLRYGYGFYLPIYSWVRLIKSYREYKDTYENCWYRDSEIVYDNWTNFRRVLALAIAVICIFSTVFCGFYEQKPVYLGENITIPQFSKNYNYTYQRLYGESGETLTEYGEFLRDFYPTQEDSDDHPQFQFELEGEYIRAVCYEVDYLYVFSDRQLPPQCITAAVSMAAAQKNINVFELYDFTGKVVNALQECEVNSTKRSGEIIVENIKVIWCEVIDPTESVMNARYRFEVSLIK